MYVWAKSAGKGVPVEHFGIKDPVQNVIVNNAIFLHIITTCFIALTSCLCRFNIH